MHTTIARLALTAAAALGAGIASAESSDTFHNDSPPRYRVVNLDSLGGTVSSGNSINDEGLVAGFSNLPGDSTRHAMLWFHGFKSELGTLGGPNSNIAWPVKNVRGLIAGIAQTDTPEPLHETWSCRFFFPTPTRSGFTCQATVWEEGRIRALPTFGGNNGFATGANNRRQVVGWAENTVHDPTCTGAQVLQFRAARWNLADNTMQELPPLFSEGDTVSSATAINDRGQAVGVSGICGTAVGGFSAKHAVLWDKGRVINLGTLGGVAWNTPMAINERGDVVGFGNFNESDGNAFNARAFLWTKGRGIQDLGTLPGDTNSQALGINERRQIVGISCGASICRAFLWEHGVMTDLNDLAPGYADHLYTANDINEDGQIAGQAVSASSGASIAFWAIPQRRHGDDDSHAASSASGELGK